MSKPFFFRIESAELLNFATDPEGEGMTLLRFAKELQRGNSDISFIQDLIDETIKFSQKKRDAAKSKWGGDHVPTTTRSKRLAEARKKGTHTKDEWVEMVAFFNDTCVKCLGEKQKGSVVKDHIKPIYQGGSDSIINLQPLCTTCNSAKGSDSTDERPAYCLHNACKMPTKWVQAPTSSSTVTEKPLTKDEEEDLRLAEWIYGLILNVAPSAKKPSFKGWANCIRLMRERDNIGRHKIAEVFKWANSDSFWLTNILSPSKLRDKFPTLEAKMKQDSSNDLTPQQKQAKATGGAVY